MPYPDYLRPSHAAISTGMYSASGLDLNLPETMRREIRAEAQAALNATGGRSIPGAKDEWTGPDKIKHFGVSAAFGCAAGLAIDNPYVAFAAAMVPGVAKELYDGRHGKNPDFSGKDLVADALGAATGVVACQALKAALLDSPEQTGYSSGSRHYANLANKQQSSWSAVVLPTGTKSFQAALNVKF